MLGNDAAISTSTLGARGTCQPAQVSQGAWHMSARDRGGHDNTADQGRVAISQGSVGITSQVERNANRGTASPGQSESCTTLGYHRHAYLGAASLPGRLRAAECMRSATLASTPDASAALTMRQHGCNLLAGWLETLVIANGLPGLAGQSEPDAGLSPAAYQPGRQAWPGPMLNATWPRRTAQAALMCASALLWPPARRYQEPGAWTGHQRTATSTGLFRR
jgi:hypothetical protein